MGLTLMAVGGVILVFIGGFYFWQKKMPLSPVVPEERVEVSGDLNRAAAQAIIDTAVDKSQVPKEVWLASGMTELEYNVIWEAGTERPGSSPLNEEKRLGKFVTKACGLEVYSSEHKYESGTGWPSFWEVNKDNVILKDDYSWLGVKRTEVLSKCGEHLGHVFEDGPEPTGLRYCMNGVALRFVPAE